ncbi:capsid related protein [Pseudomonas phage RSP]|nr:capsid related protein [Pseudomonas phage RSP]
MKPTPGDVHVNRPLSNVSVAYIQSAEGFVADRVFPNIPSDSQSDLYYRYNTADFNRDEMQERAPGTESAGGGFEVATDPFFCRVHAFHHDIPDQRRANTDTQMAPDREATEFVTMKGLIKRESQFANKFLKTGVWSRDVSGAAAAGADEVVYWDDDNSDPIKDIRREATRQHQLTGIRPNTLCLGQVVLDALLDHPDIIDRLKYGQTPGAAADVSLTDLAALFKVPRIFVMSAVRNDAPEGKPANNVFIGGKNALLCHSATSPGLMTPSAGYTFSWRGFLGASAMGGRIKKFRMEHLESDRVEIQMAFDQRLVGKDLGTLFAGIVQ